MINQITILTLSILMQQTLSYKQIAVAHQPPLVPEGDGARVNRALGISKLKTLDPFLMFDVFRGKLPNGFPDHPHRGFQTVTYVMKGSMTHEDFKGHAGGLNCGDVQWMTAGKGIMHSEMPASFEEEVVGIQLWLNLESKHKMCDPQYQEFKDKDIPQFDSQDLWVKVISGEYQGKKGVIQARTPTHYYDVHLKHKDSIFEQEIPKGWNSMIVCYEGSLVVNDKSVDAILAIAFKRNQENSEIIHIKAGPKGAKFIMIAGQPIGEPVAWKGPFVMNTEEEIMQTFQDFYEGKNGFEGASKWRSKNRDLKYRKSRDL